MPLALIVEYGSSTAAALQSALEFADYRTRVARNRREAGAELDRERPDVVVLGRLVEMLDIADACHWIRGMLQETIPVLAIGRQLGCDERKQALAAGANDYLSPPISGPILVTRVRDNLRAHNPRSLGTVYTIGDITLDDEICRVTRKGRPIHLSPTEYALLRLFMSSPGRLFNREEILRIVWGDDASIDVRNVDAHLKRVRAALKLPKGTGPIVSVRGLGYHM